MRTLMRFSRNAYAIGGGFGGACAALIAWCTISSAHTYVAPSKEHNSKASIAEHTNWPMFRGNSQLTGVAVSSLGEKLQEIWSISTGSKNDAIESSAAIVDGVVYVGSDNGFLLSLDLSDGNIRWRYSTEGAAIKASPAVAEGRVYFGDDNGVFHAIDAQTGESVWKFDTQSDIQSSPNVIGDRVLFGSYDENLYCLDVKTGDRLWNVKTEGYVHCTPAVADGKTFISGCDGLLRVIDIANGQEVGSTEIESQTGASPAVMGDRLFVGHFGNQVLGVDWKKPEIAWRYEYPERHFPFYSSPAAITDLIVVGGRDKLVHAIDPKTGVSKWTFPTKGKVDSSPAIVGRRVFVGSHDGNVYGLDRTKGAEVWRFATGGPVSASPAIADERMVIGNEDGKIFCFGAKK